jgi:hypothetical protein
MHQNQSKTFGILFFGILLSILLVGCAQIGAPTGGPKDTLAPLLVRSIPEPGSVRFTGNKLILNFDEFIELQDIQNNLLIAPFQKNNPSVNYNLRTLTLKFKDSLLPNTTYVVNFGNAIKDINEGNVTKNFTYRFSTGDYLDSLTITGRVLLAENGKTDSSLLVMLYRNAPDSAVKTRKPDYITKLDGSGAFSFTNLPADDFSIYALKDGDGNRLYNAKTELFAFHDSIISSLKNNPIELFAYAGSKPESATSQLKKEPEKKLRFIPQFINGKQDLLSPLELNFNNPLKDVSFDSVMICDTTFQRLEDYKISMDSTRKKLKITHTWQEDLPLYLIITPNAVTDSADQHLTKSDTLRFYTSKKSEYGSLKLRFKNLELNKHPMLLFMDGEQIKSKFELTSDEWKTELILPGEFEIRILYDENQNGIWDPGDYEQRRQPEKAISVPQKISIKANWENERDIEL